MCDLKNIDTSNTTIDVSLAISSHGQIVQLAAAERRLLIMLFQSGTVVAAHHTYNIEHFRSPVSLSKLIYYIMYE